MSELGQMLRQARINRGVSLDEIEDSTKIRKRYLEAIEEGNYKVLPGSFYVRAFVKTYAEAVGLQPEEVLKLYRNEVPSPETEQPAKPLIRKRKKTHQSDRFSKWASTFLMWAFPILIVAIVYYYFVNHVDPRSPNKVDDSNLTGQKGEAPPPKSTDNTPDANLPPDPSDGGSDPEAEPSPGTEPQPEPEPPAEAPARVEPNGRVGSVYQFSVYTTGPMKLELSVSGGDCWVEIKKDSRSGEILQYETLGEGDTFTYETESPLYIKVGRADRADIKVNGIVIDDGDVGTTRQLLIQRASDET